jgi:elongation factor Ts
MSTQPEPAPEANPVSAQLVKSLRERTGAGFNDCRAALQESKGDLEAATNILRKRGQASAQKKAQRQASEGAIGSYIHAGGRIGVLVEVNCESDFVARTKEFQHLCHELAMHVAALDPRFVRREEIPSEVLEQKQEAYRAEARAMGKPEQIIEKIVAGKLEKFFEESCLYEQHFIKDESVTIREMIEQMVAKVGENIALRRFARFKVGEASAATDSAEGSGAAASGADPSAPPTAAPESRPPEGGKPGAASAEN